VDQAPTLRRELNKTKREMQIPVDPEHTPELMAVIDSRAQRRPTCPFIFHGRTCAAPRFDRDGSRRPCLGDFQKVGDRACAALGMAGASRTTSGGQASSTTSTRASSGGVADALRYLRDSGTGVVAGERLERDGISRARE
jgi:hypothetical protein